MSQELCGAEGCNFRGLSGVTSSPAQTSSPQRRLQLDERTDRATSWPVSRPLAVRPCLALQRLVYRSRTTEAFRGAADFQQILKVAVRINSQNRITGALVLSDNIFVQVIEGPAARLDELMVRLGRDARHRDVDVLGRWGVTGRLFTGWAMAHSDVANACPRLRQRLRSDSLGTELINLLFEAADADQPGILSL